jgi:hypothetical protein
MGKRTDSGIIVGLSALGHAVPVLLIAVLALSGCGGKKEARGMAGMLSRTATAVDVAKSQETKRYASNELAAAEERLMRARGAAQAKEYELADRLIAETLVNINLASAKAAAARAREQVDQIKVSPDDASKSGQR